MSNWFTRTFGLSVADTAPAPEIQTRDTAAPVPPARPTVTSVTAETALGIGAVYRAVSILITSVSQMELAVYRKGKEMNTPALIKNPNVNDSASGFVQETVYSLACYGNAYWMLVRSSADAPVVSVRVLDPRDVSYTEDPDTLKVTYWYRGKVLPSFRIKHLKLMRRPGRVDGLGPIQAATSELTGAILLREFADQWFNISGVPTGILRTDMVLGPDESAAFAEAWNDFIKQHGGTAVLSQGLDYRALSLKPAEAQYLEVQQANVVNIARLFGIPQTYLLAEVTGTSNTYVNQQETNLIFLQTTLTRYMTEIETALSELLPRGQDVQFKEDQLLRMSLQLKTEIEAKQVEAGLRSADELRAADHLPPLPKPEPTQAPAEPKETPQK